MKKCPRCLLENSNDTNFCRGCGQKLDGPQLAAIQIRCPICSTINAEGTKYCKTCGQPLTQEAANHSAANRVPIVNVQAPRRTHPAVVVLTIIMVIIAFLITGPKSCTLPMTVTVTPSIIQSGD